MNCISAWNLRAELAADHDLRLLNLAYFRWEGDTGLDYHSWNDGTSGGRGDPYRFWEGIHQSGDGGLQGFHRVRGFESGEGKGPAEAGRQGVCGSRRGHLEFPIQCLGCINVYWNLVKRFPIFLVFVMNQLTQGMNESLRIGASHEKCHRQVLMCVLSSVVSRWHEVVSTSVGAGHIALSVKDMIGLWQCKQWCLHFFYKEPYNTKFS